MRAARRDLPLNCDTTRADDHTHAFTAGDMLVRSSTAGFVLRTCLLCLGTAASAVGAQDPPAPAARQADAASPGLRLDDALRRAVAQSPLVEAARARVSAARGTRRTAGVLPNPVFTYWAENLRGSGQRATTPLDRETQMYATLPLEPLFQRWPRVRGADATVRAADAELARARQVVALDAARAFYRVAAAQHAVDAAEDIRARLAEIVTFNRARVAEGVAAEADLIRVELELDRVTAAGTLDQVELARARAELAPYVVGAARVENVSSDRPVALLADPLRVSVDDGPVAERQGTLAPLASYLAQAQLARPDLTAFRARTDAARAESGYQRALTVRQVGATFGTKRTAGVTSLIAGVSLPIPLFDQNRGEIQRATGEQRAAALELAWAERQADAEVAAAYEAARLLTQQTTRLRSSFLDRAEQSRRIALAAYQEGAVSLLQVLDASRTLADARLTYYRTLFAQRQSLLDLQAATGASLLDGLGSPSDPTSPLSRSPRPTGDRP